MTVFAVNQFVNETEASVHIADLALQRGYAAFDYLRTKNDVPLFLSDYINRFFASAQQLGLHVKHTKNDVIHIIEELIRRNKLGDSGIRMIFTGGYAADSYTPTEANLIVTQQALQLPSTAAFKAGAKVISHAYQRDLPAIKSINYLMGIYLQQQVKAAGAQDVLYYKEDVVSEFPRANVFMVTADGKLLTPEKNILQGITRMKLLQLAKEVLRVEIKNISLVEIKNAAEVFMTSTTKRVLPVTQIDDVAIGNGKAGPITSMLNEQFIKMENAFVNATVA